MQDSLIPNLSWAPIETCPSAFPPLRSLLLCHSLSHTPSLFFCPSLSLSLSSCALHLPIHPSRSVITSLIHPLLSIFSSLSDQSSSPRYILSLPSPSSSQNAQTQNGVDSMWRRLPSAAQSFCPAVLQRISALCVSQCPISSVHMRCSILLGCLSMCRDYQVWQGGRQEWGLGCALYISLNVHHLFSLTICNYIHVIAAITQSSQLYHNSHDDMHFTLQMYVILAQACRLLHVEGLGIEGM